jgi:CheY-like chemotaxis protein
MSKAKILVVDDEEDIVRALSLRLKAAGYTLILANNGAQAMQLATHQLPDLIILDIGIPSGNGHIVARRLLHQHATAHIPVIFLTASALEEDRKKAFEVEPVAYLNKPFKPNDLLAVVTRAVAISQQVRSQAIYDWRII